MNTELFAVIESPQVSAQLNVVSGYNQFIRGLASLPEVRKLLGEVQSPDDTMELFFRILEILRATCDPAYENPYDAALSAYLWVLSMTDPEVAYLAADLVQTCPNCWWARKLAERLLAARKARVEGRGITRVVTQQGPVKTRTRHRADLWTIYFGYDSGQTGWGTKTMTAAHHGRFSTFDVVFRGWKPSGRNRGAGNRINRQSFEVVA